MALQTKVFSYGSYAYGSESNGYVLELTLVENSTSVIGNTSSMDFALVLRSGGNNRFSSYGLGATVTLDGKVVGSRDRYTEAKVSLGYNSAVTLVEGTVNIAHDSNGTKEMAVAFAIDMATGSYVPGPISVAGKTMTLTYIPRASTLGAADADIGSVCAISVNRKNNDFSHAINWKFGALSGYIGEDWQISDTPAKLTDTSIAFVVPESFYAQIPNAKSGVCYLTITTYSGDTQVGDPQSAQFKAKANETLCTPEVTGTVEDVNEKTLALTGDAKKLVKFFSTARCAMVATAKNGASISERRIGGVDGDSLDIPNVETADIVFTAVDSRGFPGTDEDEDISLVPYIRLTNKATCKRTDPTSGKATLTLEGDWFSGSFGAVNNALTLSYSVDGGAEQTVQAAANGDKYSATIALEGLAYQQNHTITVTVRDKLDEAVKTLTVSKGIPVFDWGESDFRFHVPVTAPRVLMETMDPANEADATSRWYVDALFDGATEYADILTQEAKDYAAGLADFAFRDVCGDANEALLSGVYLLNGTSTNVPNTNGMMLVFRCGKNNLDTPRPVWQVAMDYAGANRMCRMIWYGNEPAVWGNL